MLLTGFEKFLLNRDKINSVLEDLRFEINAILFMDPNLKDVKEEIKRTKEVLEKIESWMKHWDEEYFKE